MHNHYNDITSRIAEKPKWYDEDGVPRYCAFSPRAGANIYAREILLLEIECQSCGTRFRVAMSSDNMDVLRGGPSLADCVAAGTIHYGDPPNAGCCPSGPTMNSIPRRVVEFWRRGIKGDERVPELERDIECEWADDL